MLKKKQRNYKIEKAVIQILFFFLMPSAFSAGFAGIKNLFQWIGSGQVLQMNSFVLILLCLCGFTIIFGRFFCGYICAFGAAGDLFGALSEFVQKKFMGKKKIYAFSPKTIRVLQKLKYMNLAFIIIACVSGFYVKLSGNSPWDVFSALTAFSRVPDGYGIGLICMIAVFVGSLFQRRFFCQFLCPMGAVFSLLPVLPFFRIRRSEANCTQGCKACTMMCPANVRLEEDSFSSGECIGCGQCRFVCGKGNIAYLEEKKINAYLPAILRAAIFFIMGCVIGLL